MSLIGKKVKYEYPVNNDKTQKGGGLVVDKVRSSMIAESGVPLQYDTYMIKGDDGKVQSVHPTLITEIVDE